MKEYEEKAVPVIKSVLVKITCDICDKEISEEDNYYEVVTSHSDWGNDSHESLEEFDICSEECLKKQFDEYLDFKSNTKNIKIEKV